MLIPRRRSRGVQTGDVASMDTSEGVPFEFCGDVVAELARSVQRAASFKIPYSDEWTQQKGVWLVKDLGVYLAPAHALEREEKKRLVAYADEWHPNSEWSLMRRGSDSLEFVPLSDRQLEKLADGYAFCVTEEEVELVTAVRRVSPRLRAALQQN